MLQVVVITALIGLALVIALFSLAPRPAPLRVPKHPLVGLDRRRQQVQRRRRVNEALERHDWRAAQQAVSGFAPSEWQPPRPREEWHPNPAMGVRQPWRAPTQPIVAAWQEWPEPAPAAVSYADGFAAPPMQPQARAS
jgi:hypothetical protein